MSWNYRVIGVTWEGELHLSIHEVYYDKDGNIEGWTENPVGPCGSSLQELEDELLRMADAFEKSILSLEKLEAACEKGEVIKA